MCKYGENMEGVHGCTSGVEEKQYDIAAFMNGF